MTDDWYRRYDATKKVPSLPSLPSDDDFDHALADLRTAVHEIDERATVSSVVRILRHRQGLAAEVLYKSEPTCRSCGSDKQCLGCDDVRPEANRLSQGWQFVSPLGRWETVERVEQDNQYAPIRVWTDKTGPDYSWLIPRWNKLDAIPPLRQHGIPEIRIVEYDYSRDAPMYAAITLDTVYHAENRDPVAEAHYSKETGWTVTHRPDGGGETVVIDCDRSKAKARTALRVAARQHAKALGLKVVEQPKPTPSKERR